MKPKRRIRNMEEYEALVERVKGALFHMEHMERAIYQMAEEQGVLLGKIEWNVEGVCEIKIDKVVPEEDFLYVSLYLAPAVEKKSSKKLPAKYIQYSYNIEGKKITRILFPYPKGPAIEQNGTKALEELVEVFQKTFNLVLHFQRT